MNASLINPYIRVAMHSVLPVGTNISMRVIYDYELIYLERGESSYWYGGKQYYAHEGDLIFFCPGIEHSSYVDWIELSQPHIHFDITSRPNSSKIPVSFKHINDMTQEEKGWIHENYFSSYPCNPFIKIKNKERFLEIFYNAISESDQIVKKGFMVQLIGMIIGDNFPGILENDGHSFSVKQIKDYIDAGNGVKMSLDDFSKMFFFSKFYLEKRFKEKYGMGLIEYRNKKRMLLADELLKKLSVSSVSEELGFGSIYSFSRAYKNYYGISPSEYKASLTISST